MVSLLDFINSISQTDDIQYVSAPTVGRKVDLLAPAGRPTAPTPLLGYGPDIRLFNNSILLTKTLP